MLIFVTLLLLFFQITLAHDHIEVRRTIIRFQLAQLQENVTLVVGDSIVEGWLGHKTVGCLTFNAGMGGAGLPQVVSLLGELSKNPDKKNKWNRRSYRC